MITRAAAWLLAACLLAACLLAACGFAHELETAGSPHMEFVVENGPHANLVYHAVCIAGKISCSREAYLKLWQEKLAWSAGDERLMRAFREK